MTKRKQLDMTAATAPITLDMMQSYPEIWKSLHTQTSQQCIKHSKKSLSEEFVPHE